MLKKLKCGELAFVLGTVLSALGIALQTKADIGISMVAAPAYILSLKIPVLSFGISECLVQCGLFILCCFITKKFAWRILWSFLVAIPYAGVLDCIMNIVSNIQLVSFVDRLFLFLIGTAVLAAGIAFYFRTNLPAQIYEMFVKVLSEYKNWNINKVKIIYDWISCIIAILMSLLFFKALRGIGFGTIICTLLNGPLIALCGKFLDKHMDFSPLIKGLQN